jgi:23S rRNA (uridine2552-2'-O)-methyltransferase
MTVKDRGRLDDHWAALARREGYPARSVYKLKEMDLKHRLFKRGMRVLDLGASPGSWSMYIADRVAPSGRVLGVDLHPLNGASRPNLSFMEGDVLTLPPSDLAGGAPYDAVVSDLAPPTTGRRDADAAKSLALARAALGLAGGLLRPGGLFIAKIFEGGDTGAFVKGEAGPLFQRTLLARPKAVRKGSVELYLLGLGYRGASAAGAPEGPGEGRAEGPAGIRAEGAAGGPAPPGPHGNGGGGRLTEGPEGAGAGAFGPEGAGAAAKPGTTARKAPGPGAPGRKPSMPGGPGRRPVNPEARGEGPVTRKASGRKAAGTVDAKPPAAKPPEAGRAPGAKSPKPRKPGPGAGPSGP